MDISTEELLDIYHTMQKIRLFESKVRDLAVAGEIPGFVHVSIGEEASAAGVCAALRTTDRITSTHRGHGHLIAKGGRLDKMMAEIFGKRTGYCKGKGGSMHIVDYSLGILGANGIVGAGLPVWKLPVIFVCENNGFGEFTPMETVTSVKDIAVRAQAYGIPGHIVDGNDVLEVFRHTSEAVARARAGEGPTLLECKTYRWEGHVVGEAAFLGEGAYRAKSEIEAWKLKCPLIRFEKWCAENGKISTIELKKIVADTEKELAAAIEFARSSELPDASEVTDDVYA